MTNKTQTALFEKENRSNITWFKKNKHVGFSLASPAGWDLIQNTVELIILTGK